jgi:hypothetical protein
MFQRSLLKQVLAALLISPNAFKKDSGICHRIFLLQKLRDPSKLVIPQIELKLPSFELNVAVFDFLTT